jgi:SARP family transcriptional regulator, regulator of embCAB operon
MRSEQIRIGLLGTLKVTYTSEVTHHCSLHITAAKQRQVLAMLAANANTTVSTDHLIDELWPSDPPSTVKTIVQTYVYQLRKLFGERFRSTNGPSRRLSADCATGERGHVPVPGADGARQSRTAAR